MEKSNNPSPWQFRFLGVADLHPGQSNYQPDGQTAVSGSIEKSPSPIGGQVRLEPCPLSPEQLEALQRNQGCLAELLGGRR